MRRSPRQTLIAMAAVLGGLWIGLYFVKQRAREDASDLPQHLPDYELRDLSPEELYAQPEFQPHDNAPQTWDDISLRFYAEDQGIYTRFLRCTIDADEVARVNRDVFRTDVPRWRTRDDLPPDWWPGQADDAGEWAMPEWFRPEDGVGVWWTLPDEDRAIGLYLHYAPETRRMHLWEWRQWHGQLDAPQDLAAQPTADRIASQLLATLIRARHPVRGDDWLHATDRNPAELGLPPGFLPEDLLAIDGLMRAKRTMRYLITLRGIGREDAEALLADVAMRPLPADSPPPIERWAFALPAEEDGGPWIPSWFDPGPGPRWGYSVVHPGSGLVENARWAAYDRQARTLTIWDWREPEALRPPATSIAD